MNTQNKRVIWERGQEGGHSRPINVDQLFANLYEVTSILTKHNVRNWVSHGTMLGLYRDNGPIPWDDDADIGLDLRDRHLIGPALKELVELGYFIPPEGDRTKPINAENMPWYDTVFIRDGEKVEGWWFERKMIANKNFFIYDEPRCGYDLRHPAEYYDDLQKYECRNKSFYIPNHIEDWLVMMYGTNWKTPNKNKKYNNQR